jgi:hypothetical protein
MSRIKYCLRQRLRRRRNTTSATRRRRTTHTIKCRRLRHVDKRPPGKRTLRENIPFRKGNTLVINLKCRCNALRYTKYSVTLKEIYMYRNQAMYCFNIHLFFCVACCFPNPCFRYKKRREQHKQGIKLLHQHQRFTFLLTSLLVI